MGQEGGFHEKAKEMGCTFVQLQNRVKHFRDTVTRHDRNIENNTPRIVSDRERIIIENFGFLRQAVHIRVNARKKDTLVLRPWVSCYKRKNNV